MRAPSTLRDTSSCLWRALEIPRDDVSLLSTVLFSATARHDAVQQTSSGVNEEYAHSSWITADALSWIEAGAELQTMNSTSAKLRNISLARLMSLLMYEVIYSPPTACSSLLHSHPAAFLFLSERPCKMEIWSALLSLFLAFQKKR